MSRSVRRFLGNLRLRSTSTARNATVAIVKRSATSGRGGISCSPKRVMTTELPRAVPVTNTIPIRPIFMGTSYHAANPRRTAEPPAVVDRGARRQLPPFQIIDYFGPNSERKGEGVEEALVRSVMV
jgi:hypothetical protein